MIVYKVMSGSSALDERSEEGAIRFLKQAIADKIFFDNGGAFIIDGYSEIHRGFDSMRNCEFISFDCLYRVIT